MVFSTSSEPTVYDKAPLALFEYKGPCDFLKVSNTWKLLITDLVFLLLLDVIPFMVACALNWAIIRAMKRRAEEWGRDDPQKLVSIIPNVVRPILKACMREREMEN